MKWVLFNDLMKKGWLHNMCIAIVKPQNKTISDEYLENCFENNSDGAGIAYANNGKLYIVKGIFDKQKFIQVVRKAEKFAEGDMLIHCRIGTSGLKNKNNCHPHIVNNNLVMIHNQDAELILAFADGTDTTDYAFLEDNTAYEDFTYLSVNGSFDNTVY